MFASVFTDKETGRPRGAGKVEFLSPAVAHRAIQELHDMELDVRQVQVKFMEARAPGGGGPRPTPAPRPQRENDGRQLFFGAM